jgi:hypothetical protein
VNLPNVTNVPLKEPRRRRPTLAQARNRPVEYHDSVVRNASGSHPLFELGYWSSTQHVNNQQGSSDPRKQTQTLTVNSLTAGDLFCLHMRLFSHESNVRHPLQLCNRATLLQFAMCHLQSAASRFTFHASRITFQCFNADSFGPELTN